MRCEDCGSLCELNGMCPNCHEELFIATWQASDLDYPLSEEFSRTVEEQSAVVKQKLADSLAPAKEQP